ncbi:ubiquitin-related domain-containing protein [Endogone sp. FLAS-F59071]|nr:ubiquitin-related domain-containing protein [Endogone sp. FLAS-F59071]|eukprot:RUS17347.1 ubiquitin-related domain-containing protein [Endogone sp. FLAS-F59071]
MLAVPVDTEDSQVPPVRFTVTHGKTPYEFEISPESTILELKQELEQRTQIPAAMQKLMYKGMLKDETTIESSKIKDGVKVMLIGSKVEDILKVATPAQTTVKEEKPEAPVRTPMSEMTEHKKIISKGKPEDIETGIVGIKSPLPAGGSIKGMCNSLGQRTRLTFKDDLEQVWIGTAERTQKIVYSSIKAVRSEPIEGDEAYHILSLQLGPTEKSRYFIYWVPAQYVEAVKDTIMGNFVYF